MPSAGICQPANRASENAIIIRNHHGANDMEQSQATGKKLILRTDGAARGNPGPAALGIVIQTESGEEVARDKAYLGRLTNNQAEYRALIAGLKAIAAYQAATIIVKMDSELVVKQMRGEYRVKAPDLLPLYQEARQLVAG
jgi:ribonuclease HI